MIKYKLHISFRSTSRPAEAPNRAEVELDTVDILVPMGRQDSAKDKTLLDIYISQPTTKDLSTLDSFPLIKKLFIKRNTLVPSSASAEGRHSNFNT